MQILRLRISWQLIKCNVLLYSSLPKLSNPGIEGLNLHTNLETRPKLKCKLDNVLDLVIPWDKLEAIGMKLNTIQARLDALGAECV